jgi:arylsulfatase A-like enzyme
VVRSDLRPEVAYMGEKFMLTPNLDKFAAESLVFNRAFCQQAVR